MIAYLLQGMALGFPAAAQPGPFQAYLLLQVSRLGWRRTLPAALAPLISDGPIIALALLLLTRLSNTLLYLIQIGGGFFMLYLAAGALRGLGEPAAAATVGSRAGAPETLNIWQAVLMNALNPNPYLFWGTVGGPILLTAWRQAADHAAGFLLGMYGTLVGGMALTILLFGTAGALSPRNSRWLTLLSAAALLGFAGWQLWRGGSGLLGWEV